MLLAPVAVARRVFRGDQDYRDGVELGVAFQLAANLKTIAFGHDHVQQDDAGFRLTPALANNESVTRPLVRSILLECALAAGILCIVAGWRFTPPPRSLIPDAPLAVHIHTDKAMFQVLISPATVGSDSFVLQLMHGDGSALGAKEAVLILSLPERGIEPLERKAALGADGYWHVADVPLLYPGRWHLRIEALVTDFEKIALEDEFDVPAR